MEKGVHDGSRICLKSKPFMTMSQASSTLPWRKHKYI